MSNSDYKLLKGTADPKKIPTTPNVTPNILNPPQPKELVVRSPDPAGDYEILVAYKGQNEMNDLVRAWIQAGWLPTGGCSHYHMTMWTQAVYRPPVHIHVKVD